MSFKETEIGMIPENWDVKKISDIGEVIGGGTPKTKVEGYWNGDISWITPKDLSGFSERYIYKGERSITKEGLDNSSAKLLPKGTVLFSSRAPIGYVAIAGKELATNQGFKSIVCDSKKVNNLFIYYLLKDKKDKIEQIAGGSTFKEVSGKVVKEFKVQIPPLEEQKAIAHILSTLDEKIEINNKINKTLEEMAQAIFKHWFIDFEFPNENGEPYKSSGGEMVESELGMIPKGWEVIKLGDVISKANTGGDAIKKVPIVEYDTGIRCARVGDLVNQRNIHEWGFCEVNEENYNKYRLRKNDILITRTGTIGINYYIYEDLNAVYNNGLIRIKLNKTVNPVYIFRQIETSDYRNYINKITGETSTRPNMKIQYVLNYKFAICDKKLQDKYASIIEPIVNKINNNKKENELLKMLRDTLLPKLMSGEIRVPLE